MASFRSRPSPERDAAAAGGAQGYLVDKNGYFLQGWPAAPDGSFPSGGAPASMRVDADAFTSLGAPTTAATLAMNLPADDAVGATETYTIDVSDSAAKQHPIQLSFTKQAANTWSLTAGGGSGRHRYHHPQLRARLRRDGAIDQPR